MRCRGSASVFISINFKSWCIQTTKCSILFATVHVIEKKLNFNAVVSFCLKIFNIFGDVSNQSPAIMKYLMPHLEQPLVLLVVIPIVFFIVLLYVVFGLVIDKIFHSNARSTPVYYQLTTWESD